MAFVLISVHPLQILIYLNSFLRTPLVLFSYQILVIFCLIYAQVFVIHRLKLLVPPYQLHMLLFYLLPMTYVYSKRCFFITHLFIFVHIIIKNCESKTTPLSWSLIKFYKTFI